MGMFKSRPKIRSCYLCRTPILELGLTDHYQTHLIEVTANNGYQAYTFECDRCGGPMDQAWGGGRSNPKDSATAAIQVHGMQQHSVPL
jgi:hypothetical protein